jgi:hypothetical protein
VTVAALAVLRVWSLGANGFDLGFAAHGLAAIFRGGLLSPVSWAGWAYLEDHYSPLMVVLAPLAATSAGSYWLVVVQAMAYGVSVFLASRVIATNVSDPQLRKLLVISYALAPALLFAVFFDVHGNVLAAPFLMLCIWGLVSNRSTLTVAGGLGASLLREDTALLVLALGLLYARRRGKAWMVLVGAGLFSLIGWQLLRRPGLAGYGLFYGYVDPKQPMTALGAILSRVWSDGLLALLAIAVLLPWLLIARLRWRPLVALLLTGAPLLMADSLLAHSAGFHYWSNAPGLMLMASVSGRVSAAPARRSAAGILTLLMLTGGPLVTGLLGPGGAVAPQVVGSAWTHRGSIMIAHQAIGCLSPEKTVALTTELSPLTSHIRQVYLLPHPFEDLTGTHGEETVTLRNADKQARPDYLLTSHPPSEARDYLQSSINPLVWAADDLLLAQAESCLSNA